MSKDAQLLPFDQNEMQEEFLFCKWLHEHTTSYEILKVIDVSSEKMTFYWQNVVRCAPMAGFKSGLFALVKDVPPQVI